MRKTPPARSHLLVKLLHAVWGKSLSILRDAHLGQFDKSGKDYIGYSLHVMEMGRTEEEKIVGILHDVVEDSDWTFEALEAEGFSQEIIAALKCVTKISENENYDDFIERVKKNPLATAVKINDLTDNMDIRRLPLPERQRCKASEEISQGL